MFYRPGTGIVIQPSDGTSALPGEALETLDRIGEGDTNAIEILTDLCETMKDGSLCALGGFTPFPVMSALQNFPDDFATKKEAAE